MIYTDNVASASTGDLRRLSISSIKLGIVPKREWSEPEQDFKEFQHSYNQERLHEALRLSTPILHYRAIGRRYPRRVPKVAYDHVRCIHNEGNLK